MIVQQRAYRQMMVLGMLAGAIWCTSALHGEAFSQEESALSSSDSPESFALTESVSDMRISMDFKDANLKDVLKIFSQQSRLNFIASERVRERSVTLYLDQVSVQDALDSIIRANDLVYEQLDGSDIFVVKEAVRPAVETETKIYTLGYARVSTSALGQSTASLGRLTSSLVGQSSALAEPTGTQSDTANSASTTATAASSAAGGSSTSPIGIDRVVRTLLSEHGSLVVDERTNSLIITDIASRFPLIEQVISQLDAPTPQVMIEAEILEVSRSALDRLGVEWGGTEGQILSFTGASRETFLPFKRLASRVGAVPEITAGEASSVTAVLRALEQDGETKLLARPRILTLNNESAVIKIVADTVIGITSTSVSTTGSITQTPERVETGISLTVTPQVNKDNYVTMFIEPSVTKPVVSELFPATFVDPQTRGASTVVRVADGETVVIGGLLEKNDSKTNRKIPLLGDLPLLGAVFRDREGNSSDRELIVFITPHVMQDAVLTRPPPRVVAMVEREQDIYGDLLKSEEIDRALSSMEQEVEQLVLPERGAAMR